MKRIVGGLPAGITTLILLCGNSATQSVPTESRSSNSPPSTVPFIVEDAHGNATGTITSAELLVLDKQKHQQSILSVHTAKDLPLRFGLLLDTSRSVGESSSYAPTIKAAFDFLKQALSEPDDKGFIMQFQDEAEATRFLGKDEISNLKINLVTRGGTALYDSVTAACMGRMKPDSVQPARRVMLLITDGDDNLSRMTRNDAVAAAQHSGTVIFAISLGQAGESDKGRKILERMAEATGGSVFQAMGSKDIQKVFAKLGSLIDNMQSVTFTSSEQPSIREFRSIELKTAINGKLKVRAPDGYYDTELAPSAP